MRQALRHLLDAIGNLGNLPHFQQRTPHEISNFIPEDVVAFRWKKAFRRHFFHRVLVANRVGAPRRMWRSSASGQVSQFSNIPRRCHELAPCRLGEGLALSVGQAFK